LIAARETALTKTDPKMRTFTIWLLGADGIFLLLYGLLSLLMVPGAVGEAYLSSTRWMYGVIPTALGLRGADHDGRGYGYPPSQVYSVKVVFAH
jgi:uncharacterized membrane protein